MADVQLVNGAVADRAQSFHWDRTRSAWALVLMVASGFSALGLQIVWTQQSALWLGHEAAAVLAVITAFFGGLALGALLLGARIERSVRPGVWYGACEITIALWSLALALFNEPASRWLLDLTGVEPAAAWQWSVTLCGTFILLLPATAAMGATLPAMERCIARMSGERSSIALLYSTNTFGAVLGVTGVAFWLVPELGLVRTAAVCAMLNLLAAAIAFGSFAAPVTPIWTRSDASGTRIVMLLAVTGLLGIAYEVLVVRVLSQVSENTVYTFALLLAVYLIGTTIGAAAYGRGFLSSTTPELTREGLLHALAATCLLGIVALGVAPTIKVSIVSVLGPSMTAALAAETTLAVAGFLAPTILMGALFSDLGTTARNTGVSFGKALAANTLGGAIAPVMAGVILVPMLGLKLAVLLVALGYLALSLESLSSPRTVCAIAAAGVVIAFLGPALDVIDIPPGGHIVSHTQGALAAVSVVEDAEGVARLRINNRDQEGSSATLYSDARQALLPVLLHPAPRRALFLGLGTGITASAAAQDPTLQVDAVELVPEVVEASEYFRRALRNQDAQPHLNVIAADARPYIRTTRERYDVIVSDNYHPARSGSGALYTLEHFQAIGERLTSGGVFCQWLPLHQLDLDTLRSIVRTFLQAYPHGFAMLATNSIDTPVVGLVARKEGERFDVDEARARLKEVARWHPVDVGITDDLALFGSFIAGSASLQRFAADAPVNTDDRPMVTYRAPRVTYAADSRPRDRLVALMRALDISPAELAATRHDEAIWTRRLSAYWAARNRYLEAGRDIRLTGDVRQMLSQTREPLLAVLHISPDFRPAYDPLLRMAQSFSAVDRSAARTLLIELAQLQPTRPEAARVLKDISDAQ